MMTCFNHVQSSRNCLNTLPSARVLKVNAILEFSNLEILIAFFIWFRNSSQIIKYMNFILNFSLIKKMEDSEMKQKWILSLKIRVCLFKMDIGCFLLYIQLNEYETASYFIRFSQNLTFDCLLISVFCPEFTWAEPKIVLFYCSKQF